MIAVLMSFAMVVSHRLGHLPSCVFAFPSRLIGDGNEKEDTKVELVRAMEFDVIFFVEINQEQIQPV